MFIIATYIFTVLPVTAASLLGVVLSVVCTKQVDLTEAVDMYEHDLPSTEYIHQVLCRWKQCIYFIAFMTFTDTLRFKCMTHQFALDCFLTCILKGNLYLYSYQSMAAAIKECITQIIRVMLQLACTQPVTSCECELALLCAYPLWCSH